MKTRLIFVRHAEAEGNAKGVFHGWTDSSLTEKGRLQAQAVAEKISGLDIDVIYSSSLKRTVQTASYIANKKRLAVICSDDLKEINGGDWEDISWVELERRWPEQYGLWGKMPHLHKMPNGESMVGLMERLLTEIRRIISINKGKNVCIVTHGTAIQVLMCCFRGCGLEKMSDYLWHDNTAVSVVDYDDENDCFEIIVEGDSAHLSDSMSTVRNQEWWKTMARNKDLISWLFVTGALKVSPGDKPFWYTSGTIGPYYINTHYLFGSETSANELLAFINAEKDNYKDFIRSLNNKLTSNYNSRRIYRGVIDYLMDFTKNDIGISNIDYISGGERRDWFFSPIVAQLAGKPHLFIYKDLKVIAERDGQVFECSGRQLEGKRILHIADLITEASSFERQWIPSIGKCGGTMEWSLVVVDRKQGGGDYLVKQNVKPHALVYIDKDFFENAYSLGLIDLQQKNLIISYIKDPLESMKRFCAANPGFIEASLVSDDSRIRERARLCVDRGIYN